MMIQKSTFNAMANVSNHYQGTAKRVLCVCSAGMLRSPTIAHVLAVEYGYNTRAAGVHDYALVPLNQALVAWADEIVFADEDHFNAVKHELQMDKIPYQILNLPDEYPRMSPKLVELIKERYVAK